MPWLGHLGQPGGNRLAGPRPRSTRTRARRPSGSSAGWSETRRGTGSPRRPRRHVGPTGRRWPPNSPPSGCAEPPFDVASLAVPAVFGRGSATRSPTTATRSAGWSPTSPAAELVEIEGAAHGAHLTHPDAFAEFVRAAVARATAITTRRPTVRPPGGRTDSAMHVLVTGSSGLIGTALVDAALVAGGHRVTRLVRADSTAGRRPDPHGVADVAWDPAEGTVDIAALDAAGPFDGVVHLAGAGVGDKRWTPARKPRSSGQPDPLTGLLARTIAELTPPTGVLVSCVGRRLLRRPG